MQTHCDSAVEPLTTPLVVSHVPWLQKLIKRRDREEVGHSVTHTCTILTVHTHIIE